MTWQDGVYYAATLLFKSPFRNLWPLVLAPAAALLISNRTARLVPRTPQGSAAAAALAAMPGLVGLVVICQAIDIDKVITWRGMVLYRLTPLAAAGLVIYAIVRAAWRQVLVDRLFAVATPACGRLARAAAQLGLRVLEIPSAGKDCFVAGVLHPTVFVSSGALAQLGDGELCAALHHERVHVRSRDTLIFVTLAFLRDLAPWGRGAALAAFRAAREAAADQVAARSAGSLNLAAALLALARPGREADGAAVLSMAGADGLRWRMQALLSADATTRLSRGTWARLAAGLAVSAVLLAWPFMQWQIMEWCCLHH
jgi:Zn-dependent protease with chaperone function